ncbi:polysaccharide export outer membrane protein [Fluviicoccus keumensis]|uniref:Polysaccharide export outer membrane protein n=2 Tax=Fluviicoccus keumensis TaxID=1435465 RepID=A0A4Q7ZBT9_9GAMM|nr:polysaccharide export outer membrane protein [Fluviicoccus keumensis]
MDAVVPLRGGSDYRLGAGDKISITVFNEKELSIDVRLSDAGSFLYPFIGEVSARGLTIAELQRYLASQLSDGYLVDPKVYVNITEYRPFFVNGEVTKPGGYSYQPGLTVRKAISIAGGFTPRASLSKIYVIHEDDALGLPRQTTLNSQLRPGDIITVDQGFF